MCKMRVNKQDVVAVVLGGPSSEAEVSRRTGTAIAEALREKGYNALEVELIPERLVEQLREIDAKVVFNAVHGMYGEDGRLQSILEAIEMPYTGSGVLASAVAMDKVATKRFLISANISTPKCLIYNKRYDKDMALIEKEIVETFGVPVVIKAADQGSSIGVEIVKAEDDVQTALANTFKYSDLVLVEECIEGKELTCGVMKVDGELKALPIVMITPHSGSYDFHSKYTKGATDYLVPAPLSKEVTAYVQDLAIATYKVLDLSGVARIDVMLDAQNVGYVLEANTIPGMTATSLVPKEAAAVGIDFSSFCEIILLSAK